MKVYTVVAEYAGVVNDVLSFSQETDAEAKRDELLAEPDFNENEDTITLWPLDVILPAELAGKGYYLTASIALNSDKVLQDILATDQKK